MVRRLLCLLPLLLAGCHGAAPPPAQDAHAYPAHGTIEHISADRHLVTIHHQAIPGYMGEMTMDFPVRDERLLEGYTPGDEIDFRLEVSREDAWVDQVHRTGHVDLPAHDEATSPATGAKPGDSLDDAEFLADNGRTIHLSDFRGKAVVVTFFFTRCPLPTYCPLMNRNFAATRRLLEKKGEPANWEFLSVSFDPDFDTPRTLASYADFYRGHDPDRWLFASANPPTLAKFAGPLGLLVMRQGNNISHNLRTVVVDPTGRLFRQFNDNLWTPEQLAEAVRQAATGARPN